MAMEDAQRELKVPSVDADIANFAQRGTYTMLG